MIEYIRKSHNVTILIYHIVFPAKYRRAVIDEKAGREIKEICLEVGADKDLIHFLVQSVPSYSITKMIKILTAREVFKNCPKIKHQLWGGEFCSGGYFASTVEKHGDESMIGNYD